MAQPPSLPPSSDASQRVAADGASGPAVASSVDGNASGRGRRWLITAGLVLVAALAALPVLDQKAAQNYETLFQRAIVTFALARTL
ncbi:MAG: hypothetical protein AAGH19_11140, partial [Pseudomonadota bacterium]